MKIPHVAELLLPRCVREKKLHAQIVNRIPFDMVDAWKELSAQASAKRCKFMPREFSEIVERNSFDDREACLSSLLRFCAQNNLKPSAHLNHISNCIEVAKRFIPEWTAAESGIILRCLSKLRYTDGLVYAQLLERIACKRQKFSIHASIVALDVISTDSQFARFMNPVIEKIKANVNAWGVTESAKLALGLSNFLHLENNGSILEIIKRLLINIANCDKLESLDTPILSILATVMSRTRLISSKVMQIIYKKIETDHENLTLDNCAVFSNCISQLGHSRTADTIKYFELLGDAAAKLSSQLNGRLASVLMNAFAKAHVMHQDLFVIISKKLVYICSQLEARQIAMIAHAFVKLGFVENIQVIWDFLGDLGSYNWQELAMTLHAYTKSGANNPNLVREICKNLVEKINIKHTPTGLVNVAYSLYKSKSVGIDDCDKLLGLIAEKSASMLSRFNPTELANLCLSVSSNSKASKLIMPGLKRLKLEDVDGDSIVKIIKCFSETREILEEGGVSDRCEDIEWCVGLVKKNVHKLSNLPVSHKKSLKGSLSKLGVFDRDLDCIISNSM